MQNQFVKLDSTAAILSTDSTQHDLVLQPAANLMFAAKPLTNADGRTRFTFEEAEQACKELRIGGFEDWRLPTVKELFGIVDHDKYDPAIDTGAFPGTESNWHWTSSPAASVPEDFAWIVGFDDGDVNIHLRSYAACVRAVRSVSPPSQ